MPDWSEEHVIFNPIATPGNVVPANVSQTSAAPYLITDFFLLTNADRILVRAPGLIQSVKATICPEALLHAGHSFLNVSTVGDCTPSRSQGQRRVEPVEPWQVCCYKP